MGYLYDPEELGFSGPKDAFQDIHTGKAPKIGKHLSPYDYEKAKAKLKAWDEKKKLQIQKELLHNDYLYQRDQTNEEFDRQVRDLRNFAAQRNWGRGSATARQRERVIGQWGDELGRIDTAYEHNKEDIKRQLDYIEKKLKMQLEGIALTKKNEATGGNSMP